MTEPLRKRAEALRLYGLLAHWAEIDETSWLSTLVQWEEEEQIRRSLERRIKGARLGRFKAIDQFDWSWPTRCDRGAIEAILTLEFIQETANVILIGPNGVGKTMLAKNIAHQALIAGHTVLCTVAGQLLGDLTASDSDAVLRRRFRQYSAPDVLVIDEIGYLSYSNRHADLPFEVLNRRYEKRVLSSPRTNRSPNGKRSFQSAGCVVSLVGRLVHRSEVIAVEGESYHLKEAEERANRNQSRRRAPKAPK